MRCENDKFCRLQMRIYSCKNLVLVQWFSSHDEKDVSYVHAYNKYHYQEPLCVEENLDEPTLHHRLTYHDDYEEQEYPKLEWVTTGRSI